MGRMKIIFLDIDGVLNHQIWYEGEVKQLRQPKEGDYSVYFSPFSMSILNTIIEETGAKVVVSSSWRTGRSVKELTEILEANGFKGEIIGKTPHLRFTGLEGYNYSVPRGCEIKAWLETHKDILGTKMSKVRYVILDDDSDMLWWQRSNFIWVDPYCGLTPKIIIRAKQILNQ